MKGLTVSDIKELLDYSPETGVLKWKKRPRHLFSSNQSFGAWNGKYAGKEAGHTKNGGSPNLFYRYLTVRRKRFKAHVLAWVIEYGEWPPGLIDHIDGDGLNNKILNLRISSYVKNGRNMRKASNNTSGVTGVSFLTAEGKWKSSIQVHGKKISLGSYVDKFEAICARKSANNLYKFSHRHGSD